VSGAPLRLMLVSGSVPPMRCGVGDYTAALARSLAESGRCQVAVLTSRIEGPARAPGVEVLPLIDRWRTAGLARALGIVRAWQPEVLHVQYPSQGYDGALALLLGTAARWLLGVRLVLTLHEPMDWDLQVPAMAALIRSASALIAVRPNLRDLLHPWRGWMVAGKRLLVVPNATPLPRLVPTAERVRAVRERFGAGARALVAYFGYVHPGRAVHRLFEIADPRRHCLVIMGGAFDSSTAYFADVSVRAQADDWRGSCTVTGFVPAAEAAEILACADAVVMPFELGGGSWNTSLLGARNQGTFVLTTAREARGYDARENVYYARVGDVEEMRRALRQYQGKRCEPADIPTWDQVAARHMEIYRGGRTT
jgi:glycosyltransferase involved in cell wall biosynthesis